MKKTFTLLSLLITMLVEAVAQNDAMFVYRNDGAINGFLKSDIDSIRYSNLDVDSVLHKEYVVQEVWTVDSVYRISLAAIDSVSFVTPPTVYKEGVIKMEEELVQYVISADSLTLQLKPDTPTSLIPQTDDLLVLLEGCEVLPNGFAGKVKSINTQNNCIEVVCEQTYIEDVFDSFCSVQTLAGYADVNENDPSQSKSSPMLRAIFDPNDRVINLGPYKLSASRELSLNITQNEELALKGGTSFSVSVNPTFRIHTFLIVGAGQGLYFNSSITGNLEVASQLSIYGGLEWQHEYLNPVANIPIPYTGGLINFYLNPGLFIRANAVITTTISDYRNYTFGMAFDYSSNGDNVANPSLGGRLASHSTDIEGSIDGSIAHGTYLEVGFNLVSRELAKVCVRGELGGQLSGSFVLRNSDIENANEESVLYERLKASSLESGPFVNASLISDALVAQGGRTWQMSETENEWDIVPTFKKTKLTHTPGKATSADAYSELSGNCILPVPIGYKLLDEDDNEVADYNASINYTNTPISLEHTFEGISRDNNYTLYPKIRLFGYDILASPSAVLENAHPKITDFQVTNSEYSAGKFTNDGLSYDYKFDVALTVEIDTLDGVEDWGYVYKDPYGNIKRISLMEYGSPYTDTRYAYYRNDAKSTACLYTYVKYVGDSEYYDSEPQDYELHYDGPSAVATLETEVRIRDGKIKLSGYISGMQLYDDDECGFLYGQDSNIQSNGTKISSKHSPYIKDMYWFTSEMDKPTSWESLYFCAYIYSNGEYHYGNIVEKKNYDFLRPSLKKFYETAGGEGWSESTNWLSDIEVPYWYGILEYYDGLLTLDLPDNNLTGNAVITDFRHFNSIDLANNSLRNVYVANCTFSSFNQGAGASWWFNGNKYNLGLNVVNISVSDFLLIQGNIGSVSFKDCFLDDGVDISNYDNDNPIEASFENVTANKIRVMNAGNMSVVNCSGKNMEINNGNNVVLDNVNSDTMILGGNSISISNSSFNIIFQSSYAESVSVYKSNINGVYINSFTGKYVDLWDYVQGRTPSN